MLATILMRHFGSIILFFLLVLSFVGFVLIGPGCQNIQGSKRTKITDTTVLRMEILKSIKIPFANVDTIILSEHSGMIECGNLTEQEIASLPNPFNTKLDKKPFIGELARNNNCQVLTSKLFFDSVVLDQRYSNIPMDSMYKNKVQMTIDAEISDGDGSIIVHERYRLNGAYKDIGKRFYLDNKQVWHHE